MHSAVHPNASSTVAPPAARAEWTHQRAPRGGTLRGAARRTSVELDVGRVVHVCAGERVRGTQLRRCAPGAGRTHTRSAPQPQLQTTRQLQCLAAPRPSAATAGARAPPRPAALLRRARASHRRGAPQRLLRWLRHAARRRCPGGEGEARAAAARRTPAPCPQSQRASVARKERKPGRASEDERRSTSFVVCGSRDASIRAQRRKHAGGHALTGGGWRAQIGARWGCASCPPRARLRRQPGWRRAAAAGPGARRAHPG